MFQTFLTGLREGLEAALVVSILMSFLVRGGNRDRIAALWAGVGVAVGVSFGFGALLHFTSANLSFKAQEAFGGILSIVAVGFVTWMVFWMRRVARTLKSDLHVKMNAAIALGGAGVFTAAFLAVGREGLETALFLYPTFQAQGAGAGPAAGAVLGIVTAVVIGLLIYRGAVHLNMAMFFKVTGIALVVIAAGVLAYGVHDLQEAAILPGLNTLAWDIEGYRVTSWYGTLVKGIFNLGPQMTVLEVLTYGVYLLPTLWFLLRPAASPDVPPFDSGVATPIEHTSATTKLEGHMSSKRKRLGTSALAAIIGAGMLTGCSGEAADSTVEVTGTNDSCDIAARELAAGNIEFKFTNKADDVSELYVLRESGDVVGEVENVTTGTSRTLTVDLVAGEYEVRCKPGQTGDGFSSSFEVTGEGGTAQAAPDREISLSAVDFTYPDLDLSTIVAGETIRFEMVNNGSQQHEFEVLDPAGEAIGEVAAIDAGKTGGATITFGEPGRYTFQCILIDPATNQQHVALGMVGAFEVLNP